MKKALALVLLTAALLLTLSGCGRSVSSADMPFPIGCDIDKLVAVLGEDKLNGSGNYHFYEDISIDGIKLKKVLIFTDSEDRVLTIEFNHEAGKKDEEFVALYNSLLKQCKERYGSEPSYQEGSLTVWDADTFYIAGGNDSTIILRDYGFQSGGKLGELLMRYAYSDAKAVYGKYLIK